MVKLKLAGAGEAPVGSRSAEGGNMPAWLSLVSGVLSWLVLPLIGSLIAIVSGHKGRQKAAQEGAPYGLVALLGMVLGYLSLLLSLVVIIALLMMPGLLAEVMEDAMPQQAVATQNTGVQAAAQPVGHGGVAALDASKLWVAARMSKGMALNEITEDFPLEAAHSEFWQSIHIDQGTITAVPVGGSADQPLILLSMLDTGNKLVWVCAGTVPDFAEASCQ